MSLYEQFELMVQPHPGALPSRYLAARKKYAEGYVRLQDGKESEGRKIFEDLIRETEDDILCYEIALICHKNGNIPECESYFRKGLSYNKKNPLCCIGLVHLLTETGRNPEAVQFLNLMIENEIIVDHSYILLGDVLQILGDEPLALEKYSLALLHPGAQKIAAERMVRLLTVLGKNDEAEVIFKRFLKGCR